MTLAGERATMHGESVFEDLRERMASVVRGCVVPAGCVGSGSTLRQRFAGFRDNVAQEGRNTPSPR
jgi:hypothetical protein